MRGDNTAKVSEEGGLKGGGRLSGAGLLPRPGKLLCPFPAAAEVPLPTGWMPPWWNEPVGGWAQ